MPWYRFSINLPPEYKDPVKQRAKDQNRPVAGYIKTLIDADFAAAGIKVAKKSPKAKGQ